MKKTISAAALMVMAVGAAQAGDLPRKMPGKAAPPAPVWSWTGFYIGGYYGTSVGQSDATTPGIAGSAELNDTGIAAGLTLGYNWQFSSSGLFGIEGDIGYLGTKRSFRDFDDPEIFGVKSSWYSTLRGRLGYVTGPSLLYVTGGGAWARVESSFGDPAIAPLGVGVAKSTESGWTGGVGIETKLSRSWTAKTEYLYIDLGSTSVPGSTGVVNPLTASYDNRFHVIKTGLNYKFGEPFGLPFMLAPLSSPQRWAGFYAGVNVGGAISNVQMPSSTFLAPPGGEADLNGTGFAGGGHIGYNMVAFSNWVVGVEGDIGYMGLSRSYSDWFNTAGVFQYVPGVDTNWYGTARLRVGTSTGPAFLYATGGVAVVDVENSVVFGAASTRYSIDGARVGWTFGGGIETELTSRWSARLESLYINTGTETLTTPDGSVDFKNRFTVVRAGLSYKFGGPEVVTASY